jgi:NAD(P)-dependent dehydrogenase (short-subunit alcohol dehydrogenase family)
MLLDDKVAVITGAGSGFDEPARTLEEIAASAARLADFHPLGRPIDPEDVAKAALYLASDLAANVTGVALRVDGGYTAR